MEDIDIDCFVVTVICRIEVSPFCHGSNCNDGYVTLNGVKVWSGCESPTRGLHIILINPFKCTKLESRAFNYYEHPELAREEGIQSYVDRDTSVVLIGVTVDDPIENLAPFYYKLKRYMGVSVEDVKYRGAFSFVLQRDYPEKTVFRKAIDLDQCKNGQARLSAVVAGINIDLSHSTHTVGWSN